MHDSDNIMGVLRAKCYFFDILIDILPLGSEDPHISTEPDPRAHYT